MSYSINKKLDIGFSEAVEKVKSELEQEGFGVLTEIDVKSTLRKKLGVNYEDYLILGSCNSPFAYKALQTEKEIGLLLPCNVIVYVQNGETFVSAIDPVEAMSVVENNDLKEIANQVKEKLREVIERV